MAHTITFTSDYGLADHFVGVCHGVMLRIAPEVRILDVSHGVPRQDVVAGAVLLADCAPYLPPAVHLAIVDPGVGTTRRAVVVAAGEEPQRTLLVGPDNGLLLPAAERLGGVRAAFELAEPAYQLHPVSATFHGRDVFAPAAAHLAVGVAPADLGPPVDPADLVALSPLSARVEPGHAAGRVVGVDTFGNVALSLLAGDLATCGFRPGDDVLVTANAAERPATVITTFDEVRERGLGVLVDSFGRVAIVVNQGSAADRLGVSPGSGGEVAVRAVGAPG